MPWYYYPEKLISFEGVVTPLIWLAGIALALKRWTVSDRLLLFWVLVVVLFFQFYPLKAFNYLPLIPAVSILAGRFVRRRARRRGLVEAAAASRACGTACPSRPADRPAPRAAGAGMHRLLHGRAGRRGRAHRLLLRAARGRALAEGQHARDAGVMTLSKGSAQYALSFYAHRDAYPFGRFRLATVIPGGKVRSPRPAVRRPLPRLGQLLAATADQEPRGLLSRLLHQRGRRSTREPARGLGAPGAVPALRRGLRRPADARRVPQPRGPAWIYKVTKLLAAAEHHVPVGNARLKVRGEGFRFNSA